MEFFSPLSFEQVKFIKSVNSLYLFEKTAIDSIRYDSFLKSILIENVRFSLKMRKSKIKADRSIPMRISIEFENEIQSILKSTNSFELIVVCHVSMKSIKIDWIGFVLGCVHASEVDDWLPIYLDISVCFEFYFFFVASAAAVEHSSNLWSA